MPKYRFPLEAQDDYKGRVYFTQIIEIPPTINTSAFQSAEISNTGDGGDDNWWSSGFFGNIGDVLGSSFIPGQTFRGDTIELYLPPAQTIQDGIEVDNSFSFGIAGEAARQT